MYDCMTAVLWREIFKAKPGFSSKCNSGFVMQLSKHDDNVPLITYVSFIFFWPEDIFYFNANLCRW